MRGLFWVLSTGSWCCTRVTRSGRSLPMLLSSFASSLSSFGPRGISTAPQNYEQIRWLHELDAQASAERTGIGGWFPRRDGSGNLNTMSSQWFSMEIREEDWPWVFSKGSKPARVISTLEALAVLIALMLYYRREVREHRSSIRVVPTVTDNRGNGAALNKLMTTKYPASAVVMELACFMKKRGIRASVEWSPRAGNREADALANGDFSAFDPAHRLHCDPREHHLGGASASAPIWERGGGEFQGGQRGESTSSEKHKTAAQEARGQAQGEWILGENL